jgi:hypothetical protein
VKFGTHAPNNDSVLLVFLIPFYQLCPLPWHIIHLYRHRLFFPLFNNLPQLGRRHIRRRRLYIPSRPHNGIYQQTVTFSNSSDQNIRPLHYLVIDPMPIQRQIRSHNTHTQTLHRILLFRVQLGLAQDITQSKHVFVKVLTDYISWKSFYFTNYNFLSFIFSKFSARPPPNNWCKIQTCICKNRDKNPGAGGSKICLPGASKNVESMQLSGNFVGHLLCS